MVEIEALVNELVTRLKKRKVEGSRTTARLTAELLRSVISQHRMPPTNQAWSLIEVVRNVGEQLIAANPVELAVGNIVRRVLHIIREEELALTTNCVGQLRLSSEVDKKVALTATSAVVARCFFDLPSLHPLLNRIPDLETAHHTSAFRDNTETAEKEVDQNVGSWTLKHGIIEALKILIEDINSCHEVISGQAAELIHQNELILTFGHSRTVMEFLCAAKANKRSIHAYVAEGAPKFLGHVLAKQLNARGLQTTLITDSAVFAMISRVNMVVIGAHAVMANGRILGPVGLNMVALAAKRHAVPFVVVAGTYKLCPLHPNNVQVMLNEMRSPSEVLHFGEFSDFMNFGIGNGTPLLHVVNPAFDYVCPELVSLFITDTGGHNPSFMYQLISGYYSADDLVVQRSLTS